MGLLDGDTTLRTSIDVIVIVVWATPLKLHLLTIWLQLVGAESFLTLLVNQLRVYCDIDAALDPNSRWCQFRGQNSAQNGTGIEKQLFLWLTSPVDLPEVIFGVKTPVGG